MMRSAARLVIFTTLLLGGRALAATPPDQVVRCVEASASVHEIPPALIVILLIVEGGSVGAVSPNTNGTVDIGPMQVNTIWVPQVAQHWNATLDATYRALRDDFCANVEAGSWILRQALDEAHGDFWGGVGFYHSHDPSYRADYLRKVLRATLQMQDAANRHLTPTARRTASAHTVPEG